MLIPRRNRHSQGWACGMLVLRALAFGMVVLASFWVAEGQAHAKARWTFVTILSGRYTEMHERFERTGAGDDVNVLVLHADGSTLTAYRSLRDTDPSHAPGECCSSSGPGCCASETIDPKALGINGLSINKDAVWAFLSYALQAYPAEHFLLSFRGHWAGTRILPSVGSDGGNGISILELAQILRAFADTRAGQRLEVLNFGLCMGANTEWLYPLWPLVDYVVAAANWTNAPVSVRWRNFRWARELIKNPNISGRELASRMVDIFAEIADGCAGSPVGCSNAASGQPWIASALDMAKYPGLLSAVRDLSCALLANGLDVATVTAARDGAVCYGSGSPRCTGSSGLRDIQHFAQNLRAKVSAPDLVEAIDRLGSAHGALVMQRVFEAGQYGGQSYGLGTLFNTAAARTDEVGGYQLDSNWKLVLDRLNDPEARTGFLRLAPGVSRLGVGQHVQVQAMLAAQADGIGCVVPAVWGVEGDAISVTLGKSSVELVGLHPGKARIRATFEGQTQVLSIDVGAVAEDGGVIASDAAHSETMDTADASMDASDARSPPTRPRVSRHAPLPLGCACSLSRPSRPSHTFWHVGVGLLGLIAFCRARPRSKNSERPAARSTPTSGRAMKRTLS